MSVVHPIIVRRMTASRAGFPRNPNEKTATAITPRDNVNRSGTLFISLTRD
jgi:hypothetical protein